MIMAAIILEAKLRYQIKYQHFLFCLGFYANLIVGFESDDDRKHICLKIYDIFDARLAY
jgi:hypothetical protein